MTWPVSVSRLACRSVTAMSAPGTTAVWVAVLSAGRRSTWSAVMVAVAVTGPAAVGNRSTETSIGVAAARAPTGQLMMPSATVHSPPNDAPCNTVVPAGRTLDRTTLVAGSGPLLATNHPKRTTCAVLSTSAWRPLTEMSAIGGRLVVTVAVLLAGCGSASDAAIVTVLANGPGTVAFAWMSTVTDAPAGNEPKVQLKVPLSWAQEPCPEVASPKLTPAGSTSVRATLVAVLGPWFSACIV